MIDLVKLDKEITEMLENTTVEELRDWLSNQKSFESNDEVEQLRKENERLTENVNSLKQMFDHSQSQLNKYREALEAQGTYLSFLTHHYRALFEFARVHGYEANEKDVRQGEALRNQMSITQQALTPQP